MRLDCLSVGNVHSWQSSVKSMLTGQVCGEKVGSVLTFLSSPLSPSCPQSLCCSLYASLCCYHTSVGSIMAPCFERRVFSPQMLPFRREQKLFACEPVPLKQTEPFNLAFFCWTTPESLSLRVMCYIINTSMHLRIAQKTCLSLYTWPHTAFTLMSNPPCSSSQVCVCVWGTWRECPLIFVCLWVFCSRCRKKEMEFLIISSHHYWPVFHFRPGYKWLKALDISVKLQWFLRQAKCQMVKRSTDYSRLS